ncbi:hypothetical protein Mgra_00003545, partial [Meloidogyne graminicola]
KKNGYYFLNDFELLYKFCHLIKNCPNCINNKSTVMVAIRKKKRDIRVRVFGKTIEPEKCLIESENTREDNRV